MAAGLGRETVGHTLFVGRSARTSAAGVAALEAAAGPEGIEVVPVEVARALHLKSGVTLLDPETIVLLSGICGAILYAIVRVADTRNAASASEGK